MYLVLPCDKDAYITDRVTDSTRRWYANLGESRSLDLFKLYGVTSSGSHPNIELSRLLLHFDLTTLRDLVATRLVDTDDASFNVTLKLFDVYGGQPTPCGYSVTTHPLSKSFDEGLGRDVSLYDDYDVCNFLTASRSSGTWVLSGANAIGSSGEMVDALNATVINNVTCSLVSSQSFVTGDENLEINVTQVISATLANVINDNGFRVSFASTYEDDEHTYFVKRFASRHAHDDSKHPRLIVRYNDSIADDSSLLRLDENNSVALYSYTQNQPANLLSGSAEITGSNCVLLRLVKPSSGSIDSYFTGSQVTLGSLPRVGIYSASVRLRSQDFATHLNKSGSVNLLPVWTSIDSTVMYCTGSKLTFYAKELSQKRHTTEDYVVTVTGAPELFDVTKSATFRVNVFANEISSIVKKTSIETHCLGMRGVHYQVRDVITDDIVVPFDTTYMSTLCSSDNDGLLFELHGSALTRGHSYVIDVMMTRPVTSTYRRTSATFKAT